MNRLVLAIAAAILLAGCATPAPAPPQSSSAMRKQMSDALEAGDRPALTRAAIALALMGGSLSDATFDRIAPGLDLDLLGDRRAWGYAVPVDHPLETLRGRLRANGQATPGEEAPVAALVPAEYRLVEGIAWDAARKRLFIGTVVEGRLAYLEGGQWQEVPLGNPRAGLFGMKVDPERRLLWIATGSVEQTAVPGERMAGLIAVDLDTLKPVRRIAIPGDAPGVAGDLTVARDGTVYASNSVTGAIHRCRPGCTALETFIAPGLLGSPQGLVLSPDGTRLYVADYGSGLWVVTIRTAKARPIAVDRPAMLDGIDGLILSEASNFPGRIALIGVQNGTRPRRIVKLQIGPDLDHLIVADTQLVISPEGPEPSLGTSFDGALLYVADGQWERYGPGGVLKDRQPPRTTPIRSLLVDDIVITAR